MVIMITVMLKQEFDKHIILNYFSLQLFVQMDLFRAPDNPFPQEPIWHDLASEEPNFLLSKRKRMLPNFAVKKASEEADFLLSKKKNNVAKFCCE